MSPTRVVIEAAVDAPSSAVRAASAGADRIELNAALALGGLSPSVGLATAVVRAVRVPVLATLRATTGAFREDPQTLAATACDAAALLEAGIAGFAYGALDGEGRLDASAIRAVMRAGPSARWVLHRAFDLTRDLDEALEQAIDLGFTRILTTGGATDAYAGRRRIAELLERAAGRIEILPGGGIRSENARAIVEATGAVQIHGAFRRRRPPEGIAGLTDGVVELDERELAATRCAVDAA